MIIFNRGVQFSYQLLEKFEAGIVLLGCEIKSIRNGQISIKESHARIKDGEAWLMNAHIAPYAQGVPAGYDPIRPRKLLLKKNELKRLIGKLQEQGLSLIPLSIYIKRNHAKVELGLGRGLKKHDKRAKLKEKELRRIEQRKLRGKG
ncbi:SsrA-binding protein [candidate division Kazan bacterium RBG_13_50_9]|uniref:SsrA-binding protein n=1 Tax=candidate division Kazan bacterium RBG_13_50_9 TaxID=1798535 RepID=A0A1F4NS46_UNCK3|nr:MAG: SsrA-binding protein [candidate division Kazan bacterium RBG_13_50_9]